MEPQAVAFLLCALRSQSPKPLNLIPAWLNLNSIYVLFTFSRTRNRKDPWLWLLELQVIPSPRIGFASNRLRTTNLAWHVRKPELLSPKPLNPETPKP